MWWTNHSLVWALKGHTRDPRALFPRFVMIRLIFRTHFVDVFFGWVVPSVLYVLKRRETTMETTLPLHCLTSWLAQRNLCTPIFNQSINQSINQPKPVTPRRRWVPDGCLLLLSLIYLNCLSIQFVNNFYDVTMKTITIVIQNSYSMRNKIQIRVQFWYMLVNFYLRWDRS